MSIPALRPAITFLTIVCSLSFCLLGGCGSNTPKVCNFSGCCGPADACVMPRSVVADGIDSQISVFPVSPGGALSTPTSVPGPSGSLGLAVLNSQFVFASNSVSLSSASIDAWSLNVATGQLTSVSGSPFNIGPFSVASGLAVNSVQQVLYVADAGKVDALQIGANGTLVPLSSSPFAAGTGLSLDIDPQARFLFSTDSTPPGNVWAFTIDSTGGLTTVAGSPFAAVPNSSTSTNPSQIAVDSTGSFVYTTLLGTNQVAGFSITSSTGALTPIPGSPFATGNGPVSMTTVNNLLYISNATDRTISAYTINSTNGVLVPVAGSPFPIAAGALTTDTAGAFLYVSGPQGMLVFSIDPNTGALTQVGTPVPFAGATVLKYVL